MSNSDSKYEIRCPVHGFIKYGDWEKDIIAQPAFQRLRRIRQLAWTDQVYPGTMHTRFEHSLGVMHIAAQLYDAIVGRSGEVLESELTYNPDGLNRDRRLVRLAALLHDVGHSPFSHAAEELFPMQQDGISRFRHEHYSAAIIRMELRDVIENHPRNQNYRIKADDIAALLEGSSSAGRTLFWRELIDGQMDADRMDYLLRDSLHAGVDYGRFDWRRLLHTIQVVPGANGRAPRLGVAEGGFHAAEGLVLARYYMFTQVYFHKTRVAFDHHLQKVMGSLLPSGHFPRPSGAELAEFLKWDDWRVLGALAHGEGGDHGRRLADRDHFREVYQTPESPRRKDLSALNRVRTSLGSLIQTEGRADKSWYKVGTHDIPIVSANPGGGVAPLSNYSSVVANLAPIEKIMLYCKNDDVAEARNRIEQCRR